MRRESHTSSTVPRRQHAIEKVHAQSHRFNYVLWIAAAHEITEFFLGDDLIYCIHHFVCQDRRLADHEAADAVSREIQFSNALCALVAEVRVGCTLDYAE